MMNPKSLLFPHPFQLGLTVLLSVATPGLLAGARGQEPTKEIRRLQILHSEKHQGVPAIFFANAGRGYIGVELLGLTEELRLHFGVPRESGVMVSRIVADSPAQAAGLRVGDILTRVEGESIDATRDLSGAIRRREGGETVELEVWRDGVSRTFSIAVAEKERQFLDLSGRGLEVLELMPEDLEEQLQQYFRGDSWRERVRRLEGLDWEHFEARMRKLEERLRDLEAELEE